MKTTFKMGIIASLLLFAISCTKESINRPSSAETQSSDNAVKQSGGHFIGEHYGGGIIFWIDSNGQHGLIADTVDLGYATWWNGTNTTTGATGTAIGTGKANTRKIILSQGNSKRYAAIGCARYKGSGYTDWFLPSKDELNELYKQRYVIGGFADNYYWSSSEDGYDSAWLQFFYDGARYFYFKYDTYYVRAIRTF